MGSPDRKRRWWSFLGSLPMVLSSVPEDTGIVRIPQVPAIVIPGEPARFPDFSPEQQEPQPFGIDIPVVSNEPEASGFFPPELVEITRNAVNFRASPNGEKIGLFPNGTILERLSEETIPKDGHDWLNVSIVYIPKEGIIENPQEGYVYTGGLRRLTEKEYILLPDKVKQLYTKSYELPEPSVTTTAEDFVASFTGQTGGSTELQEALTNAWKSETPPTVSSPFLDLIQTATASTAIEAVAEVSPNSPVGKFDIKTIGYDTSFTIASFAHSDNVTKDVVVRMEQDGQTMFMIVRFSHDPQGKEYLESQELQELNKLQLKVAGVGYLTWEGLVKAYGGDVAIQIASSASSIGNASVQAERISGLPQASVILAGVGKNGTFAPKLKAEGVWYELNDQGEYIAYTEEDESGKVKKEWVYVELKEGEGEWVLIPPALEYEGQIIRPTWDDEYGTFVWRENGENGEIVRFYEQLTKKIMAFSQAGELVVLTDPDANEFKVDIKKATPSSIKAMFNEWAKKRGDDISEIDKFFIVYLGASNFHPDNNNVKTWNGSPFSRVNNSGAFIYPFIRKQKNGDVALMFIYYVPGEIDSNWLQNTKVRYEKNLGRILSDEEVKYIAVHNALGSVLQFGFLKPGHDENEANNIPDFLPLVKQVKAELTPNIRAIPVAP